MGIWMTIVLAIQLLAALIMIGLVLVQQGKGADMGASFGSGASGSLFGASGSANFLSRSTAVCATVFMGCTLVLAYMATTGRGLGPAAQGAGSVLDKPAAAASAPATGAIPGAVPAPAGGSAVPGSIPAPALGVAPAPGVIPGAAAPASGAAPAPKP
jgi:preprotein translocase subunit SecG